MAKYFVTTSETETWNDDPASRFSERPPADARVRELLATHLIVRLVRWENHQPVKEERFTPGNPPQ